MLVLVATTLACFNPRLAARETRPDTSNLVWCPDEDLEELEGYTAYLKFANTQGLKHQSDVHFTTGDVEVSTMIRCDSE